jgi:DNA polymerase V
MQVVAIYAAKKPGKKVRVRLMLSSARAGFPSPADDHVEKQLDLNDHLIGDKAATFIVRARGDSMIGAGIHDGDLLIVDRSIEARDGRVVIAIVEGNFTVKRLRRQAGRCWLEAANEKFATLEIKDEEAVIWGVVTNAIHPL